MDRRDVDPRRRRAAGEPETAGDVVEAREGSHLHARGARGADLVARLGSIRWGATWVGVLAALVVFLMLQLLLFGVGLISALDRPGNSGDEDWLSGIVGLIAFVAGGYAAGSTPNEGNATAPGVREAHPGLLNGLLVWALGTLLILTLCALGLGQLFGALGDVVGQSQALSAPGNVVDPTRIAEAIRAMALGAFFSLLVWAVASMVGSWLAGRTGTRVGHTTAAERRRY